MFNYESDWKTKYKTKIVSPKGAVSRIKNGNSVFIGTGCGEPQCLIRALLSDVNIVDVDIYQMLPFTLSDFINDPYFTHRFNFNTFFVTDKIRKAAFEGKINYIPAYLSQIPKLFGREINFDIALVQVTPPDEFGYCSLGISVDITKKAAESAKMVVAQVNNFMPRTMGDSFIHVDKIDLLVPFDEPLIEVKLPEPNETIKRIAHFISRLIEDGATIEVGIGKIPPSVLPYLEKKKDLGVHTEVVSDAFIELIEKGIITNERKTLHPGKLIASFCMGTEKLYRFVHNNPMIELHPSDYVNNPSVIAKNDKMVAINSALEVDLTGQVCSDSLGYLFFSGVGGQADFIRGASRSKGGLPIIALPSTAKDGKISRIVPHLSEGAGVTVTRAGIHFIVTEYGIGYLKGRNIYQRALEVINLAHPKFRKWLLEEAKKRHYIFQDHLIPPDKDIIYLEKFEHRLTLKDGTEVLFRPIRPTDEFAFRNFIYSFSDESLYNRFFQVIRVWPHPEAQRWVNIDYEKTMTIVGVVEEEKGIERIIAMGQYGEDENVEGGVEIALLVHENYRGMGIGEFLFKLLIKIAREKGYRKLLMTVLETNRPMIKLIKKLFPDVEFRREGGGILKSEVEI